MRNFRDLQVWQKAHRLALDLYKTSSAFPQEERYGLISQIRRAGVSIPSNIAEGCGRGSNKDLSRFLTISTGSASEVEYQLLLAHDLGFIPERECSPLIERVQEIRKMLAAFIRTLTAEG